MLTVMTPIRPTRTPTTPTRLSAQKTRNTQMTGPARGGAQRYRDCKRVGNVTWSAGQPSSSPRSTGQRTRQDPGAATTGDYLSYEENLVTEHTLDRVRKAEPEVTRTMKTIETEVPGARLEGLQYCLKGEDRFKEKVAAEVCREIGAVGRQRGSCRCQTHCATPCSS